MRSIILIDDEEPWAKEIKEFLELKKYNVEYFENPKQGLDSLKEQIYDILIIDYKLLNGTEELENGIELLTQVRAFDKLLPVILVSGQIEKTSTNVEDIYLSAIHLGVADYFKKAKGARTLYELVRKVELEKTDTTYETFKKWFNEVEDKNRELFYSNDGNKYTIKKILNEVRMGTVIGEEIKGRLNDFSLKVLNRKKK